MKDTEVIRILNDLAKDAIGDLKKKICDHIDTILDRMEKEKKEQMDGIMDALRYAPIQAKNDAAAPKVERIPVENVQKPEQSAQNTSENAQKAKESTGKSSAHLLRSKDIIKESPPGGAKREFDTGKLKALRAGGWSVKMIAEEMGYSEQTIRNYMKKEGVK